MHSISDFSMFLTLGDYVTYALDINLESFKGSFFVFSEKRLGSLCLLIERC